MFGLAQLASNMVRQDSWKSILGSFGDRRDRGRSDTMRLRENRALDDYTLSVAYKDLWLVRRVVEGLASDALRNGWGVGEDEKLENFTRLNTATHEEGAFERALHMAALKGGAGLFIGYKNSGLNPQDLLQPAPQGAEVAFLEVFDRYQLQGTERVREVDSPEYDRPQVWQVIGARRPGLRFHASRMIRFPGIPRGRSDNGDTQEDRDWGYSMLQPIWDDVVRYGVFWQAVGHLMQLASVGVLKMAGVMELLASKNKSVIEDRIDVMNETLSSARLLLLDAKVQEDYHREAVSFSDMPALLQEVQTATAGALGRPVTKLFGRSPAGMNATGESDLRNYYDEVQSYRTRVIEPRLEQLLAITEGKPIDIEFESLWQPTEKEIAEVRQINTSTNERLWSMGIWSDAELRKAENAGKLPEKMGFGDAPTAEPTRPVTTVKVVQPGENPAKPEDPKAPDTVARARELLGRHDSADAVNALERARLRLEKRLRKYERQLGKAKDLEQAADALRAQADSLQNALDESEGEARKLAREKYRAADKLARAAEAEASKFRPDTSLLDEGLEQYNAALGEVKDAVHEEWVEASAAQSANPSPENEARVQAAVQSYQRASDEYAALRVPEYEDFGISARVVRGEDDASEDAEVRARKAAAAKAIQQGPRGGKFYVATSGAKIYVK